MKTKIYSILAISFLCITLSVNSFDAYGDGSCEGGSSYKLCWASAGSGESDWSIGNWYVSAPSLTYRLYGWGPSACASFQYSNKYYEMRTDPNGNYKEITGTISFGSYTIELRATVYDGSTAQAQVMW